jgi:hypothetical protein
VENERNYDKIFFSWCPYAGQRWWRFPFIDIFYHDQNSTHIWLLGKPADCPTRVEEVFPLVLRPLGSLWLYGPREPMAHFDSRNMKGIETLCFSSTYSHKEEIFIESRYGNVNCSEINSIYPYVNRQCTSRGCNETLQLVNGSVLQKFTYDYVYRTISYVETNRSYKAC